MSLQQLKNALMLSDKLVVDDSVLLDDALLMDMLEALDLAESLAKRAGQSRQATKVVEAVLKLRRKLIRKGTATEVYSAGLFRAILDNSRDAIVIFDDAGVVCNCNPATGDMFGYAPDQVIGHHVHMLMPAPHHERHDDLFALYLQTGDPKVLSGERVLTGQRQNGTLFSMTLRLTHVPIGSRDLFAGFLREVPRQRAVTNR